MEEFQKGAGVREVDARSEMTNFRESERGNRDSRIDVRLFYIRRTKMRYEMNAAGFI